MTPEEAKERTIMTLLLKIKSGTPPQRKSAMRQITDKAVSFGASALFNQILPLMLSPALEDQERHVLVKVIDRVLFKLQVRAEGEDRVFITCSRGRVEGL
jgi:splicing factor 3B subunit 1